MRPIVNRFIGTIPDERAAWLRTFTRYRPRKIRRRPIAVFDIETADATLLGPPAGIAFTSERDYYTFRPVVRFGGARCMIDFLEHFLQKRYRGYAAYAHKGMSFDITHLFSSRAVQRWLQEGGFTVHVNVSFAVVRKGKNAWTLADSLRLIPEKLERILPTFAPAFSKAPLPTTPFSWHDPAWVARIENDTKGLFVALRNLERLLLETFGVSLALTMPATALRAARTLLPRKSFDRPTRRVLDWVRAGSYSGGRIEAYWQGPIRGHVFIYDINSAYAWALKGELPIGRGRYTRREPKGGYTVARCRVRVPATLPIPPILSRLYHHAFPVGEFQAVLTSEEIAWTRRCGAEVSLLEGWTWARTAPVFRGFIERCESLRARDYTGPLGKTVKLAQNGLYGILGMNPFRREYLMAQETPPPPWAPAFDYETGAHVPHVWEALLYKESPNQMAHWAAAITARVRVRLSEYLWHLQATGLRPLYAHTDSIWCVSPNGIPPEVAALMGADYGMLKEEARGDEAIVVGPGEAALRTANGWKISSKGWAATPEDFLRRDTQAPRIVEQVQVYRAGTGLKRGTPGRLIRKRIGNYAAMRNRLPAQHRPGPTVPRVAEPFAYDYWRLDRWYTGKLYAEPPSRRKAREALLQSAPAHRPSATRSASARAAAWKRREREWSEGYAAWLQGETTQAAKMHRRLLGPGRHR